MPPQCKIITVDTTNIISKDIITAKRIFKTSKTFFKIFITLPNPKISPNELHKLIEIIQIEHSNIIGRNIKNIAKIKKAPTPDFNKFTQPLTVEKASPSVLPTIGTQPLRRNFMVLLLNESAVFPTILLIESVPKNILTIKLKTHFVNFKKHAFKLDKFNFVDKDVDKLKAKKQFKNGINRYFEI